MDHALGFESCLIANALIAVIVLRTYAIWGRRRLILYFLLAWTLVGKISLCILFILSESSESICISAFSGFCNYLCSYNYEENIRQVAFFYLSLDCPLIVLVEDRQPSEYSFKGPENAMPSIGSR